MKKFRFEGPNTSGWGWDENPVNGKTYSMDEIEKMYGNGWEPDLIETWEHEGWEETHGKWIEVL